MKLKELKAKLNSLSEEQLEGNLVVVGQFASGAVQDIGFADRNYYYLDEDDPSELIDEQEMNRNIQYGFYDKMPKPYIEKGQFLIMF